MKTIKILPLRNLTQADVSVPGSKSYSNRALVIASLVSKKVTIENIAICDDTLAMIDCLKKLGVKIAKKGQTVQVHGNLQKIKNKKYILDAQLSGTTFRFLLALSTIIPGIKILQGGEGLNKRPIKDLVDALRLLGADIEYLAKDGFPPVKVTSSKLIKSTTVISGAISSQFLSAILMIAPIANIYDIEIKKQQVSKPYIDMTISIMKHFGATVRNRNYTSYIIPRQDYNVTDYSVEGDYSGASYFAGIAALTNSEINLKNLVYPTLQGDFQLIKILEKMGNKVLATNNSVKIIGKGIKSISVDMENCPDQIQTLAVMAAFAKGKTKIKGINSLRVKETDRVKALHNELSKMGIKTKVTKNYMEIFGGNPQGAIIETYNDHRMAMSFAIAGTKINGLQINNPDVVGKTFPDFWRRLQDIGVKIIWKKN